MKRTIGKFIACGAIALAGLGVSTHTAFAALGTINNDAWKTTHNGKTIYAQAHWIAKFGSTYYLYGEKTQTQVAYHDTGTAGTDDSYIATQVYTSTDLINWSEATQVVVHQTNIAATDYMGRVCGVIKNPAGTYVMWVKYTGSAGKGVACLTSSSPTGPFVWDHLQTAVPNIVYSYPGDGSIFLDTKNGGKPYFICSDGHGRAHGYVCPFSSDCKTINAATQVGTWISDGQEAGNMFYTPSNGYYHYASSQTNGYSYSYAFEVHSTNLLSGYSADGTFNGTTSTNTYWAQVTYCLPVVGSSGTTFMMACDRWVNYSTNYKTAGHGTGFHVWCPVTVTSASPTFNALATWKLDTAAGTWTN